MGEFIEPDKIWPNFTSGFEQNQNNFWHDLEIFIKWKLMQNKVGPPKAQNEFLHLLELGHKSTVQEWDKISELKVYPQILQVRANKAFRKLCQLSFVINKTLSMYAAAV